jgi:excisionase family DNA binding protein
MSARTSADDQVPNKDLHWLESYTGIPLRTFYQWRTHGYGPPAYRLGRHLRFRKDEVDQWLAEQHDSAEGRVGVRRTG